MKKFLLYWNSDSYDDDVETSILEGTSFDDACERFGYSDDDLRYLNRWEEIVEETEKSGFFILSVDLDTDTFRIISGSMKKDLYRTEAEAEAEADKLAKNNPLKAYYVCSVRSEFRLSQEVKQTKF